MNSNKKEDIDKISAIKNFLEFDSTKQMSPVKKDFVEQDSNRY